MIRLGIFYSLDDSLKNDIEAFKLYFSSKCKTSRYLTHIPHSTIYVFDVESNKIDKVTLEFENLQNHFVNFILLFINGKFLKKIS